MTAIKKIETKIGELKYKRSGTENVIWTHAERLALKREIAAMTWCLSLIEARETELVAALRLIGDSGMCLGDDCNHGWDDYQDILIGVGAQYPEGHSWNDFADKQPIAGTRCEHFRRIDNA